MINFIQPYSFTLDIGIAYNKACEPLEGWICITDQDTLKFEGFANHLRTIIGTIDENVVFTCMTNRLRRNNPQVVKECFDESDIDKHFNYFNNVWDVYGTKLVDTETIAGVCMVFHKKVWEKVKFANCVTFDRVFSHQARQAGFKTKLALGLYIFHLYRWGKPDPENNIEHLNRQNL